MQIRGTGTLPREGTLPPQGSGENRAPLLEEGEEPRDPFLNLKNEVHERLIRELDIQKLRAKDAAGVRSAVEDAASVMLVNGPTPLTRAERAQLAREIADEVLGLGPLEPLLADPTITEVLVNRPNRVYVEREGILYLSNALFQDDNHIMRVINRILGPIGRHVDEASPMVDARLADGSRVNVIIPPLAIDGPTISIRKFSRDVLSAEDMLRLGTLTPELLEFLKACVVGKTNIVVSGGTGTGKTTLLNILSGFIPYRERLVTIEDPAELQLQQPHVVRLETRPPNMEGKGQVVQRELVRNALRMRPDRIIVGEVRAGEAFDMLQAMNTGHEGSLTTVHCNSPRDGLARIENMVLMANLDLPVRAIREQVSSAINLMVHLTRLPDGSRKATKVTEVVGMEGDIITTQDIFDFKFTGGNWEKGEAVGTLLATGMRPKLADRLEARGIVLSANLFTPRRDFRWTRK